MKKTGTLRRKHELLLFGLSAFFIVCFLFFIDEGRFSLDFIKDPRAWSILGLYVIPIFISQILCAKALDAMGQNLTKTLLSLILGAILGVTTVVGLLRTLL